MAASHTRPDAAGEAQAAHDWLAAPASPFCLFSQTCVVPVSWATFGCWRPLAGSEWGWGSRVPAACGLSLVQASPQRPWLRPLGSKLGYAASTPALEESFTPSRGPKYQTWGMYCFYVRNRSYSFG